MDNNSPVAIITGVTGQDGAYLSQFLLKKGYRIIGLVRNKDSQSFWRLRYLGIMNKIELVETDLTQLKNCQKALDQFRPDEIYNLAAQSSVSYSFEFPIQTVGFNISSVLNLLESIRESGKPIKFYQASSSEMFGKVNTLPITTQSVLHPLSPYGISKATGHWLVNQYRESYGLYAASGILFNHESYLRPDTFFVKKVVKSALYISQGKLDRLHVGNIDVKRDFGYAKEYVKAIWHILQQPDAEDFIVCSGQSVSLREIVYYVFDHFKIDRNLIVHDEKLYRPSEIVDIYGDPAAIKTKTNWTYDLSFFEVLDLLIEEEVRNEKVNEFQD
jgi:GDPmannose 4,6-dehydratase